MSLSCLFRVLAIISDWVFSLIYFLLFVRVIMSWFMPDPNNSFFITIYRVTEPVLSLFRRIPLRIGPIDFSAMLAFLAVYVLQIFFVSLFMKLSAMF